MIEFATVSREFRSLIRRRNHLQTFLGSVFAATALILHNVLKGNLPRSLEGLEGHIFIFYALMVLVPSIILSLRMARLHGGLVLNGILYARLMQEQDFTRKGDPKRAGRFNLFGVSFLQFLLAALISGFAGAVLALGFNMPFSSAATSGGLVVLLLLLVFFKFRVKAARFAFQKIASDTCAPFERREWREHVSGSLEDANEGMLHEIGFAGLMMFSVFEKLSGLGEISVRAAGSAYQDVQRFGPWVYIVLMLVTCTFGLVIYLRIRVAVGSLSLQLDPTDRPFRPLRLTDSLLGYILLAFLGTVALHMLLLLAIPGLTANLALLLVIDASVLLAAILLEQMTLVIAGWRSG